MTQAIPGLHHVTAISGPPQANVDFYIGTLLQRLVKKTVNFDAPDTYHLYYGNARAEPGSILTFFPFVDAGPGRAGPGMASAVAYAVPMGGLDAWMMALAEAAVDFDGPAERFGERMIALSDPDGLRVELIETDRAGGGGAETPVDDGFHSVTLWLENPDPTARLLTDVFGYASADEAARPGENRFRFVAQGEGRGSVVDLITCDAPSIGRQGAGSIHHVAFRAETDEVQMRWQEMLRDRSFDVTPQIDRQYFNAIYFREPGGVLFEIATDPPGFATDEPMDALGEELKLPAQHAHLRDQIDRVLPPITLPKGGRQ
ncbi:ring-cleaving dioxygenase [Roseovarius sp. SCSIO 43702]|uniref:ring-cleaving dioxygenase n=1 Tax=Roseovarius sp. SCSIO 43702 TaxID=2823043 RepID=UPI001C73C9F5|nr:ring-cleaving dioxygenase [Roseovarius sp. SCSIO 43702]QYX57154.1 ring-cleaving dioxygenase [Roseovarius sp. SCSIO 43702]